MPVPQTSKQTGLLTYTGAVKAGRNIGGEKSKATLPQAEALIPISRESVEQYDGN